MWECQVGDQDGEKTVEHGIFPSTMEASMDDAITLVDAPSDVAEHGIFPSAVELSDDAYTMALTVEAHGVEGTKHIPMSLCGEIVPIPCENESHLAHLSDSESELSASTICEFECFHFEGMSDTPLELREVVDRSSEAILNSNNLTSTSSVFSHCLLGSMADETPHLDMPVPPMEKMYMEDDDDATQCLLQDGQVGYMEAPTSSTPTSHEREYQGMGVDVIMIPLVDMMTFDCLHAMDDLVDSSYDTFLFPCDTLFQTNVNHVELPICDDFSMSMPCFECFHFSPIVACNMLNNFSFKSVACNNVEMFDNEIAPIAFSHIGDVYFHLWTLFHPSLCIVTIHICHIFQLILVCLVMCK